MKRNMEPKKLLLLEKPTNILFCIGNGLNTKNKLVYEIKKPYSTISKTIKEFEKSNLVFVNKSKLTHKIILTGKGKTILENLKKIPR